MRRNTTQNPLRSGIGVRKTSLKDGEFLGIAARRFPDLIAKLARHGPGARLEVDLSNENSDAIKFYYECERFHHRRVISENEGPQASGARTRTDGEVDELAVPASEHAILAQSEGLSLDDALQHIDGLLNRLQRPVLAALPKVLARFEGKPVGDLEATRATLARIIKLARRLDAPLKCWRCGDPASSLYATSNSDEGGEERVVIRVQHYTPNIDGSGKPGRATHGGSATLPPMEFAHGHAGPPPPVTEAEHTTGVADETLKLPDSNFLTVEQASQILGKSERTITNYCVHKVLKAEKLGDHVWLIDRDDLDEKRGKLPTRYRKSPARSAGPADDEDDVVSSGT